MLKKKAEIQTWICIFDLHYPLVDWPTFEAAVDFIAHREVAGCILGGDQMDNLEISHWTKGKPIHRERAAYQRNTEGFDKDILSPLDSVLGKAEKVWIVGNHDRFEQDLIEEQPELEGVIERPKSLRLQARGWNVVPLGHSYRLGKLNVVHGEILTGFGNQAGLYPSKKAVELYGGNVLAGHTHAPQSYTKISPVEHTQKHMGWIAPCCCTVNPSYLRNRPTAWLTGVTVIEVQPNGDFNVFPCITNKGKFVYGGQLFGK